MDKALQRFENKYIPVTESGCWLWIAGTLVSGYGRSIGLVSGIKNGQYWRHLND